MPEFLNEEPYKITESGNLIQDKIKRHGGASLRKFMVAICFLLVIKNWLPALIGLSFPITIADVMANLIPNIDKQTISQLPQISIEIYIFGFVFNGVIALGECLFALTYIRNKKIEYSALYEGFVFYGKAFLLYFVKTLFVSIYTMFFIIPGIIATLNFSQCFYLLADNPEKGIMEILAESRYRMHGNRIAYINMLISYLPYILLSLIPLILFEYIIDLNIDPNSMNWLGIDLVLNIPLYTIAGFVVLGQCVFYELLINKGFENFKYKNQEAFRK